MTRIVLLNIRLGNPLYILGMQTGESVYLISNDGKCVYVFDGIEGTDSIIL